MTFAERVTRLEEAVFRTFGENATWTGAADPVRVVRKEADEEVPFTRGGGIVTGHRIKVRKSEVASPSIGDEVQILDGDGNPVADGAFTVSGEPRLDRKGVWTCIVEPAP